MKVDPAASSHRWRGRDELGKTISGSRGSSAGSHRGAGKGSAGGSSRSGSRSSSGSSSRTPSISSILSTSSSTKAARTCAAKRRVEAAARQAASDRATTARESSAAPPRPAFFVAGSWDGWVPHEMIWNPKRRCHHSTVQLGPSGWESFHILADGDAGKCLHPDRVDSCVHSRSVLSGPDDNSHGKFWSIGKHQLDEGAEGVCYEVRLHVNSCGNAEMVDWVRLCTCNDTLAGKYWIVGSWSKWKMHEMNWDPDRQCFHYIVPLGKRGVESFHILQNCDWTKRLYPEREDGSFHQGDGMCGPDSFGHRMNYTVGAHAYDRGAAGVYYEIRVRLGADGGAQDVDWVRLGTFPRKAAKQRKIALHAAEGDVEGAIRLYGKRMASIHDEDPSTEADTEDIDPPAGGTAEEPSPPPTEARILEQDLAGSPCEAGRWHGAPRAGFATAQDSDGEEVYTCHQCGLPIGDVGYSTGNRSEVRVHGECMAQQMIDDLRRGDRDRLQQEAALKKMKRAKYDIGWKAESIPSSVGVARRLQCDPLPEGLCCLVLDEAGQSVRVAATAEPAAAVNLAYLAVALQVRLREGREPLFSLDPVDAAKQASEPRGDREAHRQAKRFEPAWLAGTSVGEVMFQADYFLKELSMGEYEQPIVGMRSCSDLSTMDGPGSDWSAREWFVVNEAAVHLSEDSVFVPHVQMGVEARELMIGPFGLTDKEITRADHPLVKYAETFTEKFDLIAERKSVVFNLRELAKASVLAKHLMEAGVKLGEAWFGLADEEMAPCCVELPQLWNERLFEKICVRDGKIVDAEKIGTTIQGMYGGVQFGLDRFHQLGKVARVSAARAFTPGRAGMGAAGASVMGRAHAYTARPGVMGRGVDPRGIDLDLGKFDLSTATKEAHANDFFLSPDGKPLIVGDAFWQNLSDSPKSVFSRDDRKLFKAVFNSAMSDRQEEGDRFIPPDTSLEHVLRLRSLVKQEETVRLQRKDMFVSASFSMDDAGPLFPASWTSKIELAGRGCLGLAGRPKNAVLQARTDYAAAAFDQVLQSALPTFDKSTEDGLRFRIYHVGSLEVRTMQEHDGEETIGAVFSIQAPSEHPASAREGQPLQEGHKIVKVAEYVERVPPSVAAALLEAASQKTPAPTAVTWRPRAPPRRYYVVLTTEQGDSVVTEQLMDGTFTWEENPADLEDRNSLAKVSRAADCSAKAITIAEMKEFQDTLRKDDSQACARASHSCGKRYARGAYGRAAQQARPRPVWAGGGSGRWHQWRVAGGAAAGGRAPTDLREFMRPGSYSRSPAPFVPGVKPWKGR